jgi:hypothetical protein
MVSEEAYVGYVCLRRADEESHSEAPFQAEGEHIRRDLAMDAARALAARLLREREF